MTWTAQNLEGWIEPALPLHRLRHSCDRYTSAMLRDERFNGNGHISSTSPSLGADDGLEGGVSVINAVDVRGCRSLTMKL